MAAMAITRVTVLKIGATLLVAYGINDYLLREFGLVVILIIIMVIWFGWDEMREFLLGRKRASHQPTLPPPDDASPTVLRPLEKPQEIERTYDYQFMGMKVQPVFVDGRQMWRAESGDLYSSDGTLEPRASSPAPTIIRKKRKTLRLNKSPKVGRELRK